MCHTTGFTKDEIIDLCALDLGLVLGRTGHLIKRHPPPPGPDDLFDRELPPDIAHGNELVQPGVRHEDHVRIWAGRNRRPRSAGPRGGSKLGMSRARSARSRRPFCSSRRIPGATGWDLVTPRERLLPPSLRSPDQAAM